MTRPLPTRWVWEQEAHCCDDPDATKARLIIEAHDGGGGVFLAFETEAFGQWALNDEADINKLAEALKRCLRDAKEQGDG